MPTRRRSTQLTFADARKPEPGKHGGWRPRAGRKPGRTCVGHITRERFAKRHPLHVTLRVVEGVALRREAVMDAIRAAIEAAHRDDFRVTQFNVLGNHIHLVVEAAGQDALARRMQGLMIRIAKRINQSLGRSGRVFAERYHARVLRTPREVRNVLRYVLLNARHHAAERGRQLRPEWIDPYSSALWFDGWRDAIRDDAPWLRRLRKRARPTAAPTTWLLTEGWRKHGLLAFDEVPGPSAQTRHG